LPMQSSMHGLRDAGISAKSQEQRTRINNERGT
jgi:hypothetical protein